MDLLEDSCFDDLCRLCASRLIDALLFFFSSAPAPGGSRSCSRFGIPLASLTLLRARRVNLPSLPNCTSALAIYLASWLPVVGSSGWRILLLLSSGSIRPFSPGLGHTVRTLQRWRLVAMACPCIKPGHFVAARRRFRSLHQPAHTHGGFIPVCLVNAYPMVLSGPVCPLATLLLWQTGWLPSQLPFSPPFLIGRRCLSLSRWSALLPPRLLWPLLPRRVEDGAGTCSTAPRSLFPRTR